MRFYILSDLHLEFDEFHPLALACDAVVLAGDTHTGLNGLRWALATFKHCPIIYVIGNHEYYGHTVQRLQQKLIDMARGTHAHVLENSMAILGDTAVLGATLWTDYAVHGDAVRDSQCAVTAMTDYRRIRVLPGYRRLKPADTRQYHAQTRQWLSQEMPRPSCQKCMVVTHHAPSAMSLNSGDRNDPLSAAYASDMESVIAQSRAHLWVHGHIHRAVDYSLGMTRIVANPRGYPDETSTGFDPGKVIEI